MKKFFSLVITLVFILCFVSGCSNPTQTTTSTEITPATTETVTPAPTITQSSSPSPTPSLSPEEKILALAPDIAGLDKQLLEERIIYVANESNQYGLKKGDYCGYYNPEVTYLGEKIGGVALSSNVLLVILKEKNTNPKEEIFIPIPLNPCDGQKIDITIAEEKVKTVDGKEINLNVGFFIKTDKEISIVNPSSSQEDICKSYFKRTCLDMLAPTFMTSPKQRETVFYISILDKNLGMDMSDEFEDFSDFQVKFGEKLYETDAPIYFIFRKAFETKSDQGQTINGYKMAQLLTIDGKYIFIISN